MWGLGEDDETPVDSASVAAPHCDILMMDGFTVHPPNSSDSRWTIWFEGTIIGMAVSYQDAEEFIDYLRENQDEQG